MSDLVEFLRARLDEDEEAAKLVQQPYRLYVSVDGRLAEPLRIDDLHGERDGEYEQWSEGDDRMPNHITNWSLVYDPARVLAEVETKRRIIDEHPILTAHRVCTRCSDFAAERGELIRQVPGPCLTLRLLALPYATHPDYRQEWAV